MKNAFITLISAFSVLTFSCAPDFSTPPEKPDISYFPGELVFKDPEWAGFNGETICKELSISKEITELTNSEMQTEVVDASLNDFLNAIGFKVVEQNCDLQLKVSVSGEVETIAYGMGGGAAASHFCNFITDVKAKFEFISPGLSNLVIEKTVSDAAPNSTRGSDSNCNSKPSDAPAILLEDPSSALHAVSEKTWSGNIEYYLAHHLEPEGISKFDCKKLKKTKK
jgi:hypothetical protein